MAVAFASDLRDQAIVREQVVQLRDLAERFGVSRGRYDVLCRDAFTAIITAIAAGALRGPASLRLKLMLIQSPTLATPHNYVAQGNYPRAEMAKYGIAENPWACECLACHVMVDAIEADPGRPDSDSEERLTKNEAASVIGIKIRALNNAIGKGKLCVGADKLISRQDAETYKKKHAQPAKVRGKREETPEVIAKRKRAIQREKQKKWADGL